MKCPHCGQEFSDELRSDFCPSCGGRFGDKPIEPPKEPEFGGEDFFGEEVAPTGDVFQPGEPEGMEGDIFADEEAPLFTAEPSEPEGEQEYYVPWEDRDRLGFFHAWMETSKAVILRPTEMFGNLPPMGKLGDAMLYAVVWLVVAGVFTGIYGMLWQSFMLLVPSLAGESPFAGGGGQTEMLEALGIGGLSVIFPLIQGVVCLPVAGILGLVINAGIVHLFLRMFQGANHPYEATLRTLCYAETNMVICLLPFCGQYIAGIYWFVLAIIGINLVHRCGGGKAAAAVILPTVVLCVLCCLAIGLVIGGMGGLAAFMDNM